LSIQKVDTCLKEERITTDLFANLVRGLDFIAEKYTETKSLIVLRVPGSPEASSYNSLKYPYSCQMLVVFPYNASSLGRRITSLRPDWAT
jgi:hypothetical protein